VPRSTFYYSPVPESALNLELMRLIDEQYTKRPFFGEPRMTDWLRRQKYMVNHKRVARLMRVMGLAAILPSRKTSKPAPEHRKYPYLLRDLVIEKCDQVWAADITYIRLHRGFVYLVAVMDWFSRYVLAWELSTTLDTQFCVWALESALSISTPTIFNTDQGSQFTSIDFTGTLDTAGILISMDGKGRAFDNIFIERLWRTVKYEEVYLNLYDDPISARHSLDKYFGFYNTERRHSSLGMRTPEEVYLSRN
jgi:putative transposase